MESLHLGAGESRREESEDDSEERSDTSSEVKFGEDPNDFSTDASCGNTTDATTNPTAPAKLLIKPAAMNWSQI